MWVHLAGEAEWRDKGRGLNGGQGSQCWAPRQRGLRDEDPPPSTAGGWPNLGPCVPAPSPGLPVSCAFLTLGVSASPCPPLLPDPASHPPAGGLASLMGSALGHGPPSLCLSTCLIASLLP